MARLVLMEDVTEARRLEPDVIVVDLRLAGIDGARLVESLLETGTPRHALLMTTFARIESCRGAIRAPLRESYARALEEYQWSPEPAQSQALARLAEPIVRFIGSPEDAPTLQQFCRATGISAGAFRNWCRTAELKAKHTLAFARGLRATVRQLDESARLKNLLSVVDLRTRKKFLIRCGGSDGRLPASVHEFLECQQFLADAEAMAVIRAALAALGPPSERSR
jgi:CheY-like chemotaxis protein